MPRICVFCGSNVGERAAYSAAAEGLAQGLVADGYELVYGGAARGTMGVIADAVLRLGGKVHGVMPRMLLGKEIAHQGLTELHIVDTMPERKALMASLADGFIALPGGFGTLEELVETLTLAQLRVHDKPCGIINVHGYFDQLLAYMDRAVAEGFLRPENRQILLCASDAPKLLRQFAAHFAHNRRQFA